MKTPAGSLPIKMKDKGFYDEHSQTQRAIITMTLPYIENALSAMPLPAAQEPFVIVDYGCSEGKNSVNVVDNIIKNIRRRQQNQLFKVIFNDLPQNNFNKLFENIQEWLLEDKASSNNKVLTFASGHPFHNQVMSSQTVHFGYSSSAAHWLSEQPVAGIRDHIYFAGASEKEKKKLADIAANDWQNFLNSRALEMLPGAKILITMAASLTGQTQEELAKIYEGVKELNSSRTAPQEIYTSEIILQLISDIVQEMAAEKIMSKQEAENLYFPVYPRSLAEVLSPVLKTELNEKFSVEIAQIVQVPCPFFTQYVQSGDKENYARLLTEMYRAFMEGFLLCQLNGVNKSFRSERSELTGQKIIDEIFNRMHSFILARPEYYTFFPIHSVIVLVRK
jgi:hypothetical protein